MEGGVDLGGREPPLERGRQRGKAAIDKILRCKICHLSLQTSLSHRELSHRTPPLQERKFVSLFVTAGFCGKVFLLLGETRISCRMRLSHLFCERGAIRWDALHECRDSACRRPFGVRLRGNVWFLRSLFLRNAAPLRMTQRVWRFVRYNPFVAMLL